MLSVTWRIRAVLDSSAEKCFYEEVCMWIMDVKLISFDISPSVYTAGLIFCTKC